MDEKKLRRLLADLDAVSLEIKLRGVELRPETLRKRLLPKRLAAKDRAESGTLSSAYSSDVRRWGDGFTRRWPNAASETSMYNLPSSSLLDFP